MNGFPRLPTTVSDSLVQLKPRSTVLSVLMVNFNLPVTWLRINYFILIGWQQANLSLILNLHCSAFCTALAIFAEQFWENFQNATHIINPCTLIHTITYCLAWQKCLWLHSHLSSHVSVLDLLYIWTFKVT